MSDAALAKLQRHIAATGLYPPLIVRPLPNGPPDHYELLDGHHRALILARLHHSHANCLLWPVSDFDALLFLTTLNRLHGSDDPYKRADLLTSLIASIGRPAALSLLPDSAHDLDRLIALRSSPPPPPAPPPNLHDMPHAVTFFLTAPQLAALESLLAPFPPPRSSQLVALLNLNPES